MIASPYSFIWAECCLLTWIETDDSTPSFVIYIYILYLVQRRGGEDVVWFWSLHDPVGQFLCSTRSSFRKAISCTSSTFLVPSSVAWCERCTMITLSTSGKRWLGPRESTIPSVKFQSVPCVRPKCIILFNSFVSGSTPRTEESHVEDQSFWPQRTSLRARCLMLTVLKTKAKNLAILLGKGKGNISWIHVLPWWKAKKSKKDKDSDRSIFLFYERRRPSQSNCERRIMLISRFVDDR